MDAKSGGARRQSLVLAAFALSASPSLHGLCGSAALGKRKIRFRRPAKIRSEKGSTEAHVRTEAVVRSFTVKHAACLCLTRPA